jgi:hypothetical protein
MGKYYKKSSGLSLIDLAQRLLYFSKMITGDRDEKRVSKCE